MYFPSIEEDLLLTKETYKTIRNIEELFLSKGYMQIIPTLLEDYEEVREYSDPKKFVKLTSAEDLFVLRPDITVNILKRVIPHVKDETDYKLFYDSTVFTQKGSEIKTVREVGIEWINEAQGESDTEVLGLAFDILDRYTKEYMVVLSNQTYLDEVLALFSEKERKELILLLKDKYSSGLNTFKSKLTSEQITALDTLLSLEGPYLDRKALLESLNNQTINEMLQMIDRLADTYKQNLFIDFTLVPEFNYYSGIVFHAYASGSYDELIKGGRYDSLTKRFGKELPAIGFVINLEELVQVKEVK